MGNDAKNNPPAGAGMPLKPKLCSVSILNRASRHAAAAGINKAGKKVDQISFQPHGFIGESYPEQLVYNHSWSNTKAHYIRKRIQLFSHS
jgi:hypothetical protein